VKQHNPNVEIVVYTGAGHGFHADYRPSYHAEAAQDTWKRPSRTPPAARQPFSSSRAMTARWIWFVPS
jgi:dienelactone hydrolase